MNTKERPQCRHMIVKYGLVPSPSPENWNGKTALNRHGYEVRLTPGYLKQMGKMLEEGYWEKPISIRQIKRRTEETAIERERRLQQLCDSMILLDESRPVPAGSGDKLIRVKHAWPLSRIAEYQWDYDVMDEVPIKKPPWHYVPCWVFEEENPLSATVRMTFAYLCNRGFLNPNGKNPKMLSGWVSQNDIAKALKIPPSVARNALAELEELEIIHICRPVRTGKQRGLYCNTINVIEIEGRWARIKRAQACEDEAEVPTRTKRKRYSAHHQEPYELPEIHDLDSLDALLAELDQNHRPVDPTVDKSSSAAPTPEHVEQKQVLTPAHKILEKNPALAQTGEKLEQLVRRLNKTGRNEPCPCGDGKKFKKCCGGIETWYEMA